MKKLIIIAILAIANSVYSQDTTYIMTSAQCEMCKERIEGGLAKNKNIQKATLNLETNVITVVFNSKKLTKESLFKLVNKIGYDANESPALMSAYKKLPMCCRKD